MEYNLFEKFHVRIPAKSYDEIVDNNVYLSDDELANKICCSNDFVEAIYLASPSLYEEIVKYKQKFPLIPSHNFINSLLRYFFRMHTRCTPFGLFAGVCTGKFADKTNIVLKTLNKRGTSLDYHYLYQIALKLQEDIKLRKSIQFFPNNSIYYVGNQIRYINYEYLIDGIKHYIVATKKTTVLLEILKKSVKGVYFDSLTNLLTEMGYENNDAISYIDDLITSKLLISDLELSVTGIPFLKRIQNILNNNQTNYELVKELFRVEDLLKKIDLNPIGRTINYHNNVVESLKKITPNLDNKYIFQSVLLKNSISCDLSSELKQTIYDGLILLNKITQIKNPSVDYNNFIKVFKQRYENEEIPLPMLMDTDIGIIYNTKYYNNGDPFIDDILIPSKGPTNMSVEYTEFQILLHNKMLYSDNKTKEIIIEENELENYSCNWADLPPTLSSLCYLFSEHNITKLYMSSAIGPSCLNLLSRFIYYDKELISLCKDIVEKEDLFHNNAVLADVVHLPDPRAGNIMFRPNIRNYEIPYLAISPLKQEYQINTSDIMVSVRGDKIYLRSRKLDKEIIPRLSNAYNYKISAMPLFRFLCDIQNQHKRSALFFEWGSLESNLKYLPRVTYKNIIISLATWNLKYEDYKDILSTKSTESEILKRTELFREKFNIPEQINICENDNELYINLKNYRHIILFIDYIKKRDKIQLSEFIFSKDNNIVKDENGNNYTNQFIFGFYRSDLIN